MGEEAKRAANKHSKSTVAGARNSIKNILQQSELPRLVIHVSGAAREADGKAGYSCTPQPQPGGTRTFSLPLGTRCCRGWAGGTPGLVRRLGRGRISPWKRGGKRGVVRGRTGQWEAL